MELIYCPKNHDCANCEFEFVCYESLIFDESYSNGEVCALSESDLS